MARDNYFIWNDAGQWKHPNAPQWHNTYEGCLAHFHGVKELFQHSHESNADLERRLTHPDQLSLADLGIERARLVAIEGVRNAVEESRLAAINAILNRGEEAQVA